MEWHNPESPVVIIGDSNIIWWRDQEGALFHQLSADLGFPVDNLATTGGGATNTRLNFIRTAFAEPDYLKGKKVVIWCFTSRSFYNSHDGWKLVPLDKVPAAGAHPREVGEREEGRGESPALPRARAGTAIRPPTQHLSTPRAGDDDLQGLRDGDQQPRNEHRDEACESGVLACSPLSPLPSPLPPGGWAVGNHVSSRPWTAC